MKIWIASLCGWILSMNILSSQTLEAFDPNANDRISNVAIQPDGRILMFGNFFLVGGLPRDGIARVNPDGSLDPTFNPSSDLGATCLAIQPDGKIIVGGNFTSLGG